MKVFVLLYSGVNDYEPYSQVELYSNFEKAQKAMKEWFNAELGDWQDTHEEDCLEICEGDTTCSIQEAGDYSKNHSDWEILEKEIQD